MEFNEDHFTPQELAEKWKVSPDTIRREFQYEEGVVHLGKPKPHRRIYDPIRIPASVAARVHERLTKNRPNGGRP
jgi:hypothetical protein